MLEHNQYKLVTDEDFFYAIASDKEVSVLSADLIAGGKIQLFNEFAVLIGEEYYPRSSFQFFIYT